MPPRKYTIIFEPDAQDWLDRQPEDVRRRVLLILDTLSEIPETAGKQFQNATRWYDDIWGWARRVQMDSVQPGLRCIYFVYAVQREMIVVKFGTHSEDVYENGN